MKGKWIQKINNPEVSVVFVHGFLSNGQDCWTNAQSNAYWPDLLKNEPDFNEIGIYVYTYQTDFFSGNYTLGDVVDDLKERLTLDQVTNSKKLVFVCHSMGGIVARKLLVSREHDFQQKNIGLFFVASPSLGSDYANWLKPLAQLMNHSQADVLRFSQNNQWLNDLNKDFKNLLGSNRLIIHGKEIIEDKFIILTKWFIHKQVVEPFSGALYFPEPYKLPASDHFSIAKPENSNAMQHRLLVQFIWGNFHSHSHTDSHTVSIQKPDQQPTAGKENIFDSDETTSQLALWQNRLKQKLIEQFKKPELKPIVDAYLEALRTITVPLSGDIETVVHSLVAGNNNRYLHIQEFLSVIEEGKNRSPSTDQTLEELLGYLLQILIQKNCEEKDNGLSETPVAEIETAKLIGASRTTYSYVPTFNENLKEHQNGKKDPFSNNIGLYIPESGECHETAICNIIAHDLLASLGHSNPFNKTDNALARLRGLLKAYSNKPENAPIQALYLEHNDKHNPLHIQSVADKFRTELDGLIWLYRYGGKEDNNWLHTSEPDLIGLIDRYESEKLKSDIDPLAAKEHSAMNSKINLSNIGDNATVNIVTGEQSGSHVGHNNVQINPEIAGQLQQLLADILQQARTQRQLDAQQFNELSQAINQLRTEIGKKQNPNNTVLAKARSVLEGFKTVEGISTSIEKIIKLLAKLFI